MVNKQQTSPSIGIPRSIYYYAYPALWETFFHELGVNTVLSQPTTGKTMERAGLISEAEHCLSLKMFDAHLSEIVDKVDIVFIPRMLSGLKEHISCPKLGALPDAAAADIAADKRVLTIDINEDKLPLFKSLILLGRQLGVAHAKVSKAAKSAILAMTAARQARAVRPNVNSPATKSERKVFLLGHPYNLHDNYIADPIMHKLESLGIDLDLFADENREVENVPIRWDSCSKMYHVLGQLSGDVYSGVIQLCSFNCGCDSIVVEIYRRLLKDKGIAYMTLILDEHTAQEGIDTRLEAFVDSTRW